MRIQDLCKGGEQEFAEIVQRSRCGDKNLGLKIVGRGPGPTLPRSAPEIHRLGGGGRS